MENHIFEPKKSSEGGASQCPDKIETLAKTVLARNERGSVYVTSVKYPRIKVPITFHTVVTGRMYRSILRVLDQVPEDDDSGLMISDR